MSKPIEIVVDSQLRIHQATLPPDVAEELKAEFTHVNPEYAKLRTMGYAAWKCPKVIYTWTIDQGVLSLPRGGLGQVRSILARNGLDWSVKDERCEGDPKLRGKIPKHRLVLWDFQEQLVQAAIAKENCLLRAPTGSGKTSAAIGLIARLQLPALVVVWNGALLDQWVQRIEKELGLHGREIGMVRGSDRRLAPVTLAMQQTLWKMRGAEWDWLDRSFGVMVADEAQRACARSYLDVFTRLSARYRVGISANEARRDRKQFLTYDVFGQVALAVDEKKLVRDGIVHEVEVRVVPTTFECPEYADARAEFGEAMAAEANMSDVEAPDFKFLLDRIVENEERNRLVMQLAIAEVKQGNPTIALSHRREHCQRFCTLAAAAGCPSGLLLGSKADSAEFERSAAGLKARKIMFAAGTIQAVGQGIDLPAVSRGIVTTPVAGNKYLWGQVRGRMCRVTEGKTDAVVYYLWDQHCVGVGHLANLVAWNKNVKVLGMGDRWIEGRAYLEMVRALVQRKKEQDDGEAT